MGARFMPTAHTTAVHWASHCIDGVCSGDHLQAAASAGLAASGAQADEPLICVGPCGDGAPVCVDEEHGTPASQAPGLGAQRAGLCADGDSVQLQEEPEPKGGG